MDNIAAISRLDFFLTTVLESAMHDRPIVRMGCATYRRSRDTAYTRRMRCNDRTHAGDPVGRQN